MVQAYSMSEAQKHTWLKNCGHNRVWYFVNNNAHMLKLDCYPG